MPRSAKPAAKRKPVPGIFCLEGDWSPNLEVKQSVKPLLELLETTDQMRFIYRGVNTPEEFRYLIRKWPQRQYSRYSIGYLGFHGEAGHLYIGRQRVSLEELADQIGGACQNRIIYFGSCAVLAVPRLRIEKFRKQTGARCVAGYTKYLDWLQSSAFDLLLFDALTQYKRLDAVERKMHREYPGLVRKLGFKMFYG